MANKATRRETLCLVSHHPMALEGFERALKPLGYRIESHRLESSLAPDVSQLSLPEAMVYVVDTLPTQRATESLVAGIRDRNPEASLVTLAEAFTESAAFPLLRMGVKGLLNYAQADEQLPRAVKSVAGGGYWVPRSVLSRFVDSMLGERGGPRIPEVSTGLSPREQEVLEALLENLANKEIGVRLNISERTVKFHVSNLLQKFGVQRRADLILLCYQDRPPRV